MSADRSHYNKRAAAKIATSTFALCRLSSQKKNLISDRDGASRCCETKTVLQQRLIGSDLYGGARSDLYGGARSDWQ